MFVRETPFLLYAAGLVVVFVGCGGGGGESTADGITDNGAAREASAVSPPPVVAIGMPERTAGGESAPSRSRPPRVLPVEGGPAKGTPEWYLQEISVLRTSSLPDPRTPKDARNPEAGTIGARGVELALESRNKQIVDLAMQVIVKTHENAQQLESFNEAVRRLLEARLQLALTGNEEYGRDLYTDAQSFHARNPKSEAAAIAAHAVLRYAQTNAYRFGREDREWIEEYARQARLFANNFPQDEGLCASALAGAARSCELNGMPNESVACHTMLVERFPDSQHAKVSAGMLRRLKLVGQPLKLAGPTIDGGFTSIDDHRDRVVLVVFWESAAKPFREQLPTLKALGTKYEKFGLSVMGICLDETESDADEFLGVQELNWSQLFYSESDKRGWEHPAAEYYGVRDVPTYFLVDHTGVVRYVAGSTEKLEDGIRTYLLKLRAALKEKQG